MNRLIGIMSSALDASALRQKSISNNIANADTPNYKPTKVSFEEMLQQEVQSRFAGNRTYPKHFVIGASHAASIPSAKLERENTVFSNSGNGVDLDFEMTQLSQNTIWYQSLTYGLNEEFNLLKASIRGRG
ncbi:flagellar basal body rod protein FlgB [Neobacillus kokaensis]|uniref:Flagellar basal body rod protein FlgB n=1 Tax=Neobacillus kokaensis TaxID=2759023 RepID=A0ABQ3N4W4_9BACI|nr:flagellar basal body rod protein FlgB [Neobacillus kokaensis]GHH99980.1 flagellar basal body rod protein FlgB [Neobacillus kokaensis]